MTSSSCNACDGPLKTRFDAVLDPETRETFGIAECEACGLGHTTPQPADLNCYYGQNYHGGRHSLTAAYCAKRRLRLVTRAAGSGRARRLLDVACGDGTFLLAARDAGWKVVGTEIAAGIARAAGLDVVDSLEQAQEKGPFDCITLWHSLEHMRDPRAILKDLAQQLTPDGSLVIAVPNAEGLQARVFGPFWFHLDVPRHLYHFGDRSITQLLNNVSLLEDFYPVQGHKSTGQKFCHSHGRATVMIVPPRRKTVPRAVAGKASVVKITPIRSLASL